VPADFRRCGVEVIILYPSGKVSNIQEKQLTTLGQNIKALEVDGVLMIVRTWWAFLDDSLTHHNLTSNSINIARFATNVLFLLLIRN
jgi:threonine synthase